MDVGEVLIRVREGLIGVGCMPQLVLGSSPCHSCVTGDGEALIWGGSRVGCQVPWMLQRRGWLGGGGMGERWCWGILNVIEPCLQLLEEAVGLH